MTSSSAGSQYAGANESSSSIPDPMSKDELHKGFAEIHPLLRVSRTRGHAGKPSVAPHAEVTPGVSKDHVSAVQVADHAHTGELDAGENSPSLDMSSAAGSIVAVPVERDVAALRSPPRALVHSVRLIRPGSTTLRRWSTGSSSQGSSFTSSTSLPGSAPL